MCVFEHYHHANLLTKAWLFQEVLHGSLQKAETNFFLFAEKIIEIQFCKFFLKLGKISQDNSWFDFINTK